MLYWRREVTSLHKSKVVYSLFTCKIIEIKSTESQKNSENFLALFLMIELENDYALLAMRSHKFA